MSVSCELAPNIGGKKSRFYVQLHDKTGKNRPLTNFLYGLSKTQKIAEQFTKKELNSQGEPSLKAFSRVVPIDDIMRSFSTLQEEKRSIGAIDSNNKTKYYNTPDALFQRVVDYNREHSTYQATIKHSNNGFYIDLNVTDASNYITNQYLLRNKARYDALMDYLRGKNFNVRFTEDTISKIANFVNVMNLQSTIKDMILTAQDDKVYRMNPVLSRMMLELFSGITNTNMDYLMNRFGTDTAYLLAYLSGSEFNQDDVPENIKSMFTVRGTYRKLTDAEAERKVNALLDFMQQKMSSLDNTTLNTAMEVAVQSAAISEESTRDYYGVNASEIKTVLHDLYQTSPFLDKDTSEILTNQINTVKEAVQIFLNKKRVQARLAQLNRKSNAEDQINTVKSLDKDIKRGEYAESIMYMMEDLNNQIKELMAEGKSLENSYKDSPEPIKACNLAARPILETLRTVKGYKDIVTKLTQAKSLSREELDIPDEVIDSIVDAAYNLKETLEEAENWANNVKFDVVYSFMSIYWGKDDTVEDAGVSKSLRNMLYVAQHDINFFDRFIYGLNESNDEILGLFSAAVKDRQRARDMLLQKVEYIVNKNTEKLNGSSAFMYVRGEKGIPTGKLISPVDFTKYEEAKKAYSDSLKEQGIKGRSYDNKMARWVTKHTEVVQPFTNSIYTNAIEEYMKTLYDTDVDGSNFGDGFRVPKMSEFGDRSVIDNLTQAQKEYYYRMMALKAVMSIDTPDAVNTFFNAVQVSSDFINAFGEAAGSTEKMLQMIKNRIQDKLVRREDDDAYGENLENLLEANELEAGMADLEGFELMRLPLFFTHNLKDMSRLSTDFSHSMLAFSSSAAQYNEMSKVVDALMLVKDWVANDRRTVQDRGGRALADLMVFGRNIYAQSVYKNPGTTSSAAALEDFSERIIYGRLKKRESIMGIPFDKLADTITGYNSIKGLSMNVLGAQANLFVGKLQMIIEASCGEFFNMADFAVAEGKYFQMLPELLIELYSNNKKSKLALLMDRFDVTDDYMSELKRKGFYNNTIAKILGNSELMFMYDMGEHMLHAETMLAILHRRKVYDTNLKKEVSMLNAYEVEAEEGSANGILKINTDRFKWIEEKDGNKTYRDIIRDDEILINKQISYCNKSMHGAFGDIDKGQAHKYAFMRLVLNFRQWMPGHYERRFRGRHRDADLGEWREGFYVTLGKFAWELAKDLKDAKFQWGTHYRELTDDQKANLTRAFTESVLLVMISTSIWSMGKYKDKHRNKFYKTLLYELKRMEMEVKASNPLSADGFIKNALTMMNSPMASLTTIQDAWNLVKISDLLESVEKGRHKGENLYFHNLEKLTPYRQLQNFWNIDKEDYLFQMFDQK